MLTYYLYTIKRLHQSIMNRIFYSAIVLGTGACSLPHTLMAQQQPHIILIVSDQHRGDALNCMGNPSVITPNLDALA